MKSAKGSELQAGISSYLAKLRAGSRLSEMTGHHVLSDHGNGLNEKLDLL